jgi:iron complex transport system ATP-binding protein
MVLHDLNLATRYCDQVVVLRQGQVVTQGSPREAITQDVLRGVFGVEAELLTTHGGHLFCAPERLAAPK